MTKISKIVSGGQTGADRGALEACVYAAFPYGGWVPKSRKAEDGAVPPEFTGVSEMRSADYVKRTEANVVDSGATLIFTEDPLKGGSKKTAELCEKHKKPCLHIDLANEEQKAAGLLCSYHQPHIIKRIKDWLEGQCPQNPVLNIAGSRESKSEGLQHKVKILTVDLLIATRSSACYLFDDEG